jgi:hypothetical protein
MQPPGADGGSGNVSNRRSSGSDSGSSGDDGVSKRACVQHNMH